MEKKKINELGALIASSAKGKNPSGTCEAFENLCRENDEVLTVIAKGILFTFNPVVKHLALTGFDKMMESFEDNRPAIKPYNHSLENLKEACGFTSDLNVNAVDYLKPVIMEIKNHVKELLDSNQESNDTETFKRIKKMLLESDEMLRAMCLVFVTFNKVMVTEAEKDTTGLIESLINSLSK
jgi:hypothetical protein